MMKNYISIEHIQRFELVSSLCERILRRWREVNLFIKENDCDLYNLVIDNVNWINGSKYNIHKMHIHVNLLDDFKISKLKEL